MDSIASFESLLTGWFQNEGLPSHLWPQLYSKLKDDVFDSGAAFSLAKLEGEDEEDSAQRVLVCNHDLKAGEDVWLVDHAWTFKYREARAQLEANDSLRHRVAAMLDIALPSASGASEGSQKQRQEEAAEVFANLWKLVGSYRPSQGSKALDEVDDKDHDSIWYVLDEVGSAVIRRPDVMRGDVDEAVNVRIATMPVCFPEKGCVFSVLWVVKDSAEGEVCATSARYAVHALGGPSLLVEDSAAAADRRDRDQHIASTVLFGDEAAVIDDCQSVLEARVRRLDDICSKAVRSPCGHSFYPRYNGPLPIPFHTDSSLVVNFVTDASHFSLVGVVDEAKVMWMAHYAMRRSDEFPHASFVSQLPEERFFTNKRELAKIVQSRLGHRPWFAVTYDATTELQSFIADFRLRQALCDNADADVERQELAKAVVRGHDGTNLWIAKPCNLARSIDMTVSDSLPWLLRVAETGPKIFCKYISNPCTLRGRKFDLRFVAAVRSLNTTETPLEAYTYDVFWTRFASEQYTLDSFDVYDKHWTVMNYASPDKLLQLHFNDFIPEFNAKYDPLMQVEHTWETVVYPRIKKMLFELFNAVEPDDIPHARFRASYGVDVMIREERDLSTGALADLQPVLLEITFSPDCHRACKYHPHFFNDVFSTLFLGEPKNMQLLTDE